MERTINFDGVTAFLAVVETQSFTKAAERLGIAKSAVSRRVSDLEDALGVRLIHRTTRKLHLTDAGTAYAAHVGRAVTALTDANEAVRDLGDSARGRVRITAPVDLGATFLPDVLLRFRDKHPEIAVDCVLAGRQVDLVAEGVDLALRFGPLQDSSLVARKLSTGSSFFVASPGYAEKHGLPKKLSDLSSHELVLFKAQHGKARLELEGPKGPESVDVTSKLTADDLSFLRRAVLDGAGIALLMVPRGHLGRRRGSRAGPAEVPESRGARAPRVPVGAPPPSPRLAPHRAPARRAPRAPHRAFVTARP